jgi:hypothetical protein
MKKFLLSSIAAVAIFALSPQSYAQTQAKPAASAPSKPTTTTSIAGKPATTAAGSTAKPQFTQGQHGAAKPVIGQAGHGVERKGIVAHGRDEKVGRDERFARDDRGGRDPRLVRDERFHGGDFHRDVRVDRAPLRHEEVRRDRHEIRRP